MLKNCPNCGAPVDGYIDRCPYCKTHVYDFSEMEVNGAPIFLKIRDGKNTVIVPVVCTNLRVEVVPEEMHYRTGDGRTKSVLCGQRIEIDARFSNVNIELSGGAR